MCRIYRTFCFNHKRSFSSDGELEFARRGRWHFPGFQKQVVGKYWPDKKHYLGSDIPGDIDVLHFPAFSVEAARFLVTQRKIHGVGIDTASMDYGPSRLFEVHGVILGAGLYGLENVAHTDHLPPTGATIIALPMKIRGGSGAPTRIIAVLP
jgi:kynurenine formamidase